MRFYTGLSIFDVNLAKSACLEDRPLQRSEDLNFSMPYFSDKQSASHAKFDQDRTSGSWVMQSFVQKTSNARPPFFMGDNFHHIDHQSSST